MNIICCMLFVCMATLLCKGQTNEPITVDVAPAPSARFPSSWYPPDNDVTYTTAPQRNAPYVGTLVTTFHVANSASGEVKVLSQSTKQARDSAGRTRTEEVRPRPDGHGGVVQAHEVEVSDPVSHCSFRWMEPWIAPGKAEATVTCMPRTVHYNQQNIYADSIVSEPKEVHSVNTVDRYEPLGKRQMDNLEAVGVRHTRTRTNAQTGEVLSMVIEMWYSPELKEMLEMDFIPHAKDKAEESQLPSFKLTNISREEPNPALFYPPAGYEIAPGH